MSADSISISMYSTELGKAVGFTKGAGELAAAMLDALLELRVLRIDCSSCIRCWTRCRPRGVRLLEVGCKLGDRVADRGTEGGLVFLALTVGPLREVGHSVRATLARLPPTCVLLLAPLTGVTTLVAPLTTEAFV